MDIYSDPENVDEIIQEIRNLNTLKDVNEFVSKLYPDWLVHIYNSYCNDYPHLQRNHEMLSKKIGTSPKGIITVKSIVFDDKHKLLGVVCELLTRCGFVVRRDYEFTNCTVCGDAIPSRDLYIEMKARQLIVPNMWRNNCSKHELTRTCSQTKELCD